jgi:hypothetical protein
VGDVPEGIFAMAEKKLAAQIHRVFEKTQKTGCDLFGVKERLEKYEKRHFYAIQDTALQGAIVEVNIHFRNIR